MNDEMTLPELSCVHGSVLTEYFQLFQSDGVALDPEAYSFDLSVGDFLSVDNTEVQRFPVALSDDPATLNFLILTIDTSALPKPGKYVYQLRTDNGGEQVSKMQGFLLVYRSFDAPPVAPTVLNDGGVSAV